MKKQLFITFLCSAVTICAQDIEYPKKVNLQPIEKMQLHVQYDVDWRYNLDNHDKIKHDKMYTEIGHNVCHSYIEREWKNEIKFNKSNEEKGKRGTNAMMALYSNIGEVFVGYPKGKNTVIYSLDAIGTYKYEEVTPKLKWNISNEKLDTLGYHCTQATCSYAGRQYNVWFTEDIPVSFGPWKLCGLPGLIIKAETVDGDYRFVMAGIEIVKKDTAINLWKRDFITTSKKKTRKQEMMLLARPDAILDQMGIIYKAISRDGSPVKVKFLIYDNPLEKE